MMMDYALPILTGLVTLMLTGLGVMSMFAPRKMLENFAVEPKGAAGLNTIRSVIGGMFLASVALLLIGQITGRTDAYVAVAILMLVIAFGRIIGNLADGFAKSTVPPLVVEIVIATILLLAWQAA